MPQESYENYVTSMLERIFYDFAVWAIVHSCSELAYFGFLLVYNMSYVLRHQWNHWRIDTFMTAFMTKYLSWKHMCYANKDICNCRVWLPP